MKPSNEEAAPTKESTNTAAAAGGKSFSSKWTAFIQGIHAPILMILHTLTNMAARYPINTASFVAILSFALMGIGIATNFAIDVDEDRLWTPVPSYVIRHMDWIDEESGFAPRPRDLIMNFHRDGGNLLDDSGVEQIRHVFEAVDSIRNLADYDKVCAARSASDEDGCAVHGITNFWNDSAIIFEEDAAINPDAVIQALSALEFPDGRPVAVDRIFGLATRNEETGLLESALSFSVLIDLPYDEEDVALSIDLEEEVIEVVQAIDVKWEKSNDISSRVEIFADRSFSDEFERGIVSDIPLVPIVFVVMGIFTSIVFYKKDAVRSRSLLGFTAVVSVFFSIMAGYGIMFISGIPLTSMTQILPFVFFGVGLDDAFIITGSFFRLDTNIDIVQRVRLMVDDIGISIFLTTTTSGLAFGLGCMSSIPAVYWLCLYAVPTIALILLFQLTFFVACLVLDERRMQANKRDCLCCGSAKQQQEEAATSSSVQTRKPRIDKWMNAYAEKLLHPTVKKLVLVVFLGITIACALSASQLKQAFKFTDVLPSDSYITDFMDVLNKYTTRIAASPIAYFRNVDQSDPLVRAQMEKYVNDLVDQVDGFQSQPQLCWFRDFETFASNSTTTSEGDDFVDQLDAFLATPLYGQLYTDDLVRDKAGKVLASRCVFRMVVDLEDVTAQVDALTQQRSVSEAANLANDDDDFTFFTYDENYNIWEFYERSGYEILFTTISGVVAVTVVTLLLVPHWTAALFVMPLISLLYVDLLGVMQWAGVSINPVSYVTLVMSIGLLVDFILHVLLRFYETPGNRTEKTVALLETMGSSVFIGGVTTFLGTLPLAFSTSDIFQTVFVAFVGLVSIGVTHGLILLPVVLSMIGPEEDICAPSSSSSKTDHLQKNDGVANAESASSDDDAQSAVLEVYA